MAAERSGGGRRRAGTAATAAEGRRGLRESGAADLGLLYLAGPELKSARSGLTRVGRGLLGRLRRRAQAAGTAGDGTGGEASANHRLKPGVASRSQEAAVGGEGGDGDDGGKGGGAFPVAGVARRRQGCEHDEGRDGLKSSRVCWGRKVQRLLSIEADGYQE
ncbi:uncharacterized protein LOC109721528 [Ananas comosus]|uniref:Uncharacterized protein LOC109721528 n=1 Tax=Ananas comosus TaxID=4615 RepID=A0A6P5GAC1_ANACO|nr:uncharacterized protein LOC109721528 [Ananas comosus]